MDMILKTCNQGEIPNLEYTPPFVVFALNFALMFFMLWWFDYSPCCAVWKIHLFHPDMNFGYTKKFIQQFTLFEHCDNKAPWLCCAFFQSQQCEYGLRWSVFCGKNASPKRNLRNIHLCFIIKNTIRPYCSNVLFVKDELRPDAG